MSHSLKKIRRNIDHTDTGTVANLGLSPLFEKARVHDPRLQEAEGKRWRGRELDFPCKAEIKLL